MLIQKKQTFADLKNDFAFKKTFASEESKDLLTTMLNIMLETKLEKPIKSVIIKDPYIKGETKADKESILDIKCEDTEGNSFIVEMQIAEQKHFVKRVVYYSCCKVNESGKKGKNWNFNFPKIYSLNFMDFDLPIWENIEDVVLNVSFFDEKHREIKYDYINLVFVRLPKFTKTLEECDSLMDKLIFTFKHATEFDKKPEHLKGKFFEKLFGILKFTNFDNMERSLYESRLKAARDEYAQREWALEKGLLEGMQKGMQKGREEGRTEARNELFALLESGVSLAEAKKRLKIS